MTAFGQTAGKKRKVPENFFKKVSAADDDRIHTNCRKKAESSCFLYG
jgi:hypothetical protein